MNTSEITPTKERLDLLSEIEQTIDKLLSWSEDRYFKSESDRESFDNHSFYVLIIE
jgi:hypothetical protein